MEAATAVWWAVQAGARLGLAARTWYLEQLADQPVPVTLTAPPTVGVTSAIDFFNGDGQALLAADPGLRELHRLAQTGEMTEADDDARWLAYRHAHAVAWDALTRGAADAGPEARYALATLRSRREAWAAHAALVAVAVQTVTDHPTWQQADPRSFAAAHLAATIARAAAEALKQPAASVDPADAARAVRALLLAAATLHEQNGDWLLHLHDLTLRNLLRNHIAARLKALHTSNPEPWGDWALSVWGDIAAMA